MKSNTTYNTKAIEECVAVAEIPEIQKLTIKITPIEGQILDLEMIGKKMIAMAEICKCFSKENEPDKEFYVGLGFAKTNEDNSFEFQTVIMPIVEKGK